ncbi:MAG TPA: FtsX-like permease family protein [Spirochaetia bacterium]|nr:FtsX-like permease family protein [Spirochaetia bacterium]
MVHPIKTLLMAMRNLLRGGRRTVSTLLAITVGLVGLTLLDGYITYSMNGLRETVIHSGTGHLQVVKSPAFFDEGDTDPFPFMLDRANDIEKALRAMPEVKDVVPGLSFTAVVSANGKTSTVLVTALPIDRASANLSDRGIDRGKDLASGESGRILVGRGVARKLGLAPNDSLSLFALSRDGGVNTQSYTISGTTASIIAALDNVSVFMDLGDAQSLIGNDTVREYPFGEYAVPQLIVFLRSTADTARVTHALRGAAAGSALSGLTVRTWEELSPYYRQANSAYQLVLAVARLIVLIVALFSISGTLSLAVMERLREVGTLRAFGTRRPRVLFMLVFEGLILGIGGALIGCLAGAAVSGLINVLGGITMPPQPGTSSAFRILFTPEVSKFFANAGWVLAASLVGALFPGMLASRRKIADLLRAQ